MERMLDELDPREFDLWVAWSRLHPDAETRLAEILKLGFSAVAGALGLEVDPETLDPLSPKKVAAVATRRKRSSPNAELVSPTAAAQWARTVLPGRALEGTRP